MKNPLLAKAAVVVALSFSMIIVINLVGGVVAERQQRQTEASAEISSSYSGAQRTGSPILVIPYAEEYDQDEYDEKHQVKRTVLKRLDHQLVYFPTELSVNGDATIDWKHRGLFRALVYEWRANEAGAFSVPAVLPYSRQHPNSRILPGTPSLIVPLTDPRGLVSKPIATLDGHDLVFERGSGIGRVDDCIHAAIPLEWLTGATPMPFSMRISLRGTESFGFVPYGESTQVSLESAWPNPSFTGAFLPSPQSTHISKIGFAAGWEVSGLATSSQSDMLNCLIGVQCNGLAEEQAIEVHFIEPINIYSLSNRAIKYGFLFVALIFSAFLLFELVKRLRIHPAQYLLVGLAIAIFFLLLISISEHLEFWLAYLIAASASTLLITVYLAGILGGIARGASFGVGLSILYGCLFGLLSSEDNALVLGSGLLFVLLAAAMLTTRKLDWYDLQERIA